MYSWLERSEEEPCYVARSHLFSKSKDAKADGCGNSLKKTFATIKAVEPLVGLCLATGLISAVLWALQFVLWIPSWKK